MNKATVSIIICTCNRADHLRQTLTAFASIDVPQNIPVELIVVDNASTDETEQVVRETSVETMCVRYVHEARHGQCYARNTGLTVSSGEIILFTDDDVRPPQNWITEMCKPILTGQADGVQGEIRLAPSLERSWMLPVHRAWLAEYIVSDNVNTALVGANMGFSRKVLEKVPAFDVELGPGGLGFGDDSLFAWQLQSAGYRIVSIPVSVEHHFQAIRLSRSSLLDSAVRRGESLAYIYYHWLHSTVTIPLIREWKHSVELICRRLIRRREWHSEEGAPSWELELVKEIHFFKQYRQELQRPRNYETEGLKKRVPQ